MTVTDTNTDSDANLDAFRPLVASAWKEGELSDLELAAVCLEIMRDPTLDLSCRDALNGWLGSSVGSATHHASVSDDGSRMTTAVSPGRSAA
jgi:hypothetical protein